jgi:arsenite methyltransferase
MSRGVTGTVKHVRPDRGKLRAAIEDAFTELALHPARDFHFVSGAPLAARLGYTPDMLSGIPKAALASFAGVGNPFRMGLPAEGDVVLDIGCGSGTDVLIAARAVGPSGRVIGVDMTPAMVERAEQCVLEARASNVRIEWGHAESLPLRDASVDLALSNGVFSLTPNKLDTFAEVWRVLRPGGVIRFADVVVRRPLPAQVKADVRLWTDCIAGATAIEDYPGCLTASGFGDVEMVEVFDVFAGTRIERQSSAYEARGANIRAVRR